MLRFAVERIGDRVTVTAGLLPGHTPEVADEARAAGELGAAAFQVFTPPAFLGAPLAAEPVAAYYEAIAGATDVPLIAYQAPAGLGVTFEPDVLLRLADVPGVQAIKESSWSRQGFARSARVFAGEAHEVALLSGQDSFILDSLRMGADGAMLAAAASDAAVYSALWERRASDEASALQAAFDPYLELLFAPPLRDFRSRLKAVLAAAIVALFASYGDLADKHIVYLVPPVALLAAIGVGIAAEAAVRLSVDRRRLTVVAIGGAGLVGYLWYLPRCIGLMST